MLRLHFKEELVVGEVVRVKSAHSNIRVEVNLQLQRLVFEVVFFKMVFQPFLEFGWNWNWNWRSQVCVEERELPLPVILFLRGRILRSRDNGTRAGNVVVVRQGRRTVNIL